MEIAIMRSRRGKIVPDPIQRFPAMTMATFQSAYRGAVATAEDIRRDKVEMPGPDFQLWKASSFYVAFKERN
jgi:hypothetical protein